MECMVMVNTVGEERQGTGLKELAMTIFSVCFSIVK